MSVCLTVCLSVCLTVCLSYCQSVCQSVFVYLKSNLLMILFPLHDLIHSLFPLSLLTFISSIFPIFLFFPCVLLLSFIPFIFLFSPLFPCFQRQKDGYKPGDYGFDPLGLYSFRSSFGIDRIDEKLTREEKISRAKFDMELCEVST